METPQQTYTVSGPKGLPGIGMIKEAYANPLRFLSHNAVTYGDLIPFHVLGQKVLQINHPDLIKYILVENHKNYIKSKPYIRTEAAIGQGLITGNGERWKRDRQKIQPMFNRTQIEGYYFEVVNQVSEKYKRRWLDLTISGEATVDITYEMAAITLEVIVKILFGKDDIGEEMIQRIHNSYDIFLEYLKAPRLFPKIDLRKSIGHPAYFKFKRELDSFDALLAQMIAEYRSGARTDKYNMLALLLAAQKEDPEHFSDRDIRDQCATMIFAGYETTSILMQWLWYTLDQRPDEAAKIRADIAGHAPVTQREDSAALAFDEMEAMDYLGAAVKETMRMYPSIWMTGREPVEADTLGGYKVEPGLMMLLPQIVIQRHPRYWDEPNAFIPNRFTGENEEKIQEGLYFPFSLGVRKCTGHRLALMEAKTVFAKLLPIFQVRPLNTLGNGYDPAVSLKLKQSLKAEIRRL